MAMLRVGYYPILSNTSEHAFAIMEFNGEEYRFQCGGGTNDNGRVYPANYYYCRNMWYSRDSSRSNETAIACNPRIAIALAQWDWSVDWSRHDYNRTSGGWLGMGDRAGIIYAVNGVCHQMCNTIACASWAHDPMNSYINWPPSLNASKLLYGNRGSCGHEDEIKNIIAVVKRIYGDEMADDAVAAQGEEGADELAALFAGVRDRQRAALRRTLDNGPDAGERRSIVSSLVPGSTEGEALDALLAADADAMAEKHELDNQLVRGQLGRGDFADRTNALVRTLVARYEAALGEAAFSEAFGASAGEVGCNVVDPALMPESYDGLREELGL